MLCQIHIHSLLILLLLVKIECKLNNVQQMSNRFVPSISNIYQYIMSAINLYRYEAEIENYNYMYPNKFRLIAMPLTKQFKIPNLDSKENQNSQNIDYSDACIVPYDVGKTLINQQSYPYILQINKLKSNQNNDRNSKMEPQSQTPRNSNINYINTSYISILNFHAPCNYIYIPGWLMKAMNIQAGDTVDLRYVQIQSVAHLKLKPVHILPELQLSSESYKNSFGIEANKTRLENKYQVDLETQLNKYATLTQGTIIPIASASDGGDSKVFEDDNIQKSKVQFYEVVELRNKNNQIISSGLIQDNDVALTIV